MSNQIQWRKPITKNSKVMTQSNSTNLAGQTSQQIADRYIAKQAIFAALKNGREISMLDSQEFEVSQMHTTITNIRAEIREKNLPYVLKDRWITFGKYNKRCKAYSLEHKTI